MGVDRYDGCGETDYNEPYQWAPVRPAGSAQMQTIDHNILALRAQRSKPEHMASWITRPIQDVRHVTLDFQARDTSNAGSNSRDRIWFGSVSTGSQTHPLWGFATWQEWRDHLAPQDRGSAQQARQRLVDEIQQHYLGTGVRLRHWVAKRDAVTAPGFWAITAEWPHSQRYIWIGTQDQQWILSRRATRTNAIDLGREVAGT